MEAKRTVAAAHAGRNLISPRQMGIKYEPTLEPILDVVLLAFVYCEERRRQSTNSASTAMLSGGGISAGTGVTQVTPIGIGVRISLPLCRLVDST